jgi:ATP-binding cassette, subfamily F, member 3
MSLVRFEQIHKSFAGEPLLEGVDFRVEAGEHIGLIGRNGTGKSTIFRLITGELEPEKGRIERMRRLRIACLAQLPRIDAATTIHNVVMESFRELRGMEEKLGILEKRMAEGDESVMREYSDLQDLFTVRGGYGYRVRIRQVLQGLGFRPEEFELPFKALSGGQRTRLMLALVLLQDADLLLLDEPENHLDLEAREWVESYLAGTPKAVVIISHDRRMLNAVVTRIVEVERGGLLSHTGNYDAFQKQKALLREQQQAAFERQQEFIRKEEAWINRFRYKNTKARQVQSRIRHLEKMELAEAPLSDQDSAGFELGEVVRSGAVVLDVRDCAMGFGDLTLYSGVTFQVQRGERVGIIGPNGSGKTTLLRQIAGLIEGRAGTAQFGHKVKHAFYEQNHESLNPANDVLTEVHTMKPDWTPGQMRSFLSGLLFTGDDVFKPVSTLSGGELSRAAMAKLMLSGANLLLLDEPTNHLDIASREALENALAEYPGTILMASHDRALIDRMADKLIIVADGRAEAHLGNYSHYRWKQQAEIEEKEAKKTDDVLKIRRGKSDREKKKAREREDRRQKRELARIESDIARIEELVADYDRRFADLDPADYETANRLQSEYEGLKSDLGDLYAEWESLAEEKC